ADNNAATKATLSRFGDLFNNPTKTWIGHNIKYDMLMLKWYGVELKGKIFDTMLAHYLIDPDGKNNMDWLSAKYLNYEPIHIEELIGRKGKNQLCMKDIDIEKVKEYAAEDADVTLQFKNIFIPKMKERQVDQVFEQA